MAKVLLVEPDKIIADNVTESLIANGHEVNKCRNAFEAMKLVDNDDYDIMVLELALAGNGGIELLYEMRSYSDLLMFPVIVFSFVPLGQGGLSKQNLRQLGISKYLYKPSSSLEELLFEIDQIVNVGV